MAHFFDPSAQGMRMSGNCFHVAPNESFKLGLWGGQSPKLTVACSTPAVTLEELPPVGTDRLFRVKVAKPTDRVTITCGTGGSPWDTVYVDLLDAQQFSYTMNPERPLAKPCPAVDGLMRALNTVPFLRNDRYKINSKGKVVTMPRLQWRAAGGLNRHDAGLALDIILFSSNAKEAALADRLIEVLVELRASLQYSSFVYRDQIWKGTAPMPMAYTEDRRHFDHIHIDWLDWQAYLRTNRTAIPWPKWAYVNPETLLTSALRSRGLDKLATL